jgi:UDP-N-acetylmuramoylalanine--D-glutamate ligase
MISWPMTNTNPGNPEPNEPIRAKKALLPKQASYGAGPVSALIVGLAREGMALTRFLVERGARVTVTDLKSPEALADNVAALAGLPLTYALGGHPLTLLDTADVVFVSPGVPIEMPLLEKARQRGLPLHSETRLFTRLCPAPVLGITGSSGKTTTTALVGEMLKATGRQTWVGGNIGQPLISYLHQIRPTDAVVMELSSFQLEFFAPWPKEQNKTLERSDPVFDPAGLSPPLAAVLNITPNHLDRHRTMEAYVAAKAHILDHQRPGDTAILNLDNRVTRQMGQTMDSKCQVLWFSLVHRVKVGAFLRDNELVLRLAGHEQVICQTKDLKLMGRHNIANVLAACALASAAGAPVEALRQTTTTFSGVEHRLELVRERDRVRWYNDSIATTPERTMAALRSFDTPIVLLAGGRDKHLPWDEMAALTGQTVRHLILFGEAAGLIEEAMCQVEKGQNRPCQIHHAGTLECAVELAAAVTQPGDVVLFSPGGTSFDAYRDFEERGECFRLLVQALE